MKVYNRVLFIGYFVVLILVELAGTAYLSFWREAFWESVSNKHLHDFLMLIGVFTGVALLLCVNSGVCSYLGNRIALEWRYKLTRALFKKPISQIEGYAQRLQEDAFSYPILTVTLFRTFFTSILLILFYSWLIATHLGWYYLLIPLAYGAISSFIAGKIAFPLINLNYLNQVTEASLRLLCSKRAYARTHRNNYSLFKKTKHLNYFQSFYGQLGVIFPYILLSSAYFGGTIVFGVLMQMASAIAHLVDSLGVVVTAFGDINKYLSCRRRLKELGVI